MQVTRTRQKRQNLLHVVIISALALTLTVIVILSASWRYQHDAPLLFYFALLMEKFKAVPYVDFLDMNAPGTYFAYVVLAKIFGYSDFWLRVADFLLLLGIAVSNWFIQRRYNRIVAVLSVLLFGVLYIGGGPFLMLQREFIVLAMFAPALWIAIIPTRWNILLRAFLIGIIFGAILLMRPPFVVMFPPVAFYLVFEQWEVRLWRSVRLALLMGVGFALPVIGTGFYLWQSGAWAAFWEMVHGYWPIYVELDAYAGNLSSSAQLSYIREQMLQSGNNPWLMAASFLILISVMLGRVGVHRRQTFLLAALFIISYLYPILSNKFHPYHWLPFWYMASLICGLAFNHAAEWKVRNFQRLANVSILMAVFIGGLVNIPIQTVAFFSAEAAIPENGIADELSRYIRQYLKPGEQAQTLASTGGATHAMLITETRSATPYVYDFYFYHSLDHPFIQRIRRDFIDKLRVARPQLIIREMHNSYASGIRDKRIFPELDQFVAQNYRVAVDIKNRYIIFERIDPVARGSESPPTD